MKAQRVGGTDGERRFAVVLDTGDEVVANLRAFAASLGGTGASGHLYGVGAVRHATIAFWNPGTRQYEHREVNEQAEVVSLIGNVALTGDADVKLHAHIVLAPRDNRALGGHLVHGVVHPTLELLFVESASALRRAKDADTGLDLLDLP